MSKPVDLPDINIWLALGLADHPHHQRALDYWGGAMGQCAVFCRITALGMVRLLINTTVMAGDPLSPVEAWAAYRRFLVLPEVGFAPEHEGVEDRLAGFITADKVTPRLWTDAYLAAFALSAGMRVVSFDSDFARFEDLDCYRP